MTARAWQERVGLTDEQLFADYAERIGAAADPEQAHRAVRDRAHQFVDPTYPERLHALINEKEAA